MAVFIREINAAGDLGPGQAWVERILDDSVQVGDVAMALDDAGRPHIAYQNLTLKKLRLTSGNP